jgi:hypothetical protein
LRLLEDRETKLAALKAALAEGEASGFVNFSLDELNRELDATLGRIREDLHPNRSIRRIKAISREFNGYGGGGTIAGTDISNVTVTCVNEIIFADEFED